MRRELLRFTDFICPNEFEAERISGIELRLPEQTEQTAAAADSELSASELLLKVEPLLKWFLVEAAKLGNHQLVC